MKGIIIRICAWYTFVLCLILSLVQFIIFLEEGMDVGIVVSFFMLILFSITGWNARRYGLKNYNLNVFMKLIAIPPLILVIVFMFFIPIWAMSSADLDIPDKAIWLLIFIFLPGIISSVAILITKVKKNIA